MHIMNDIITSIITARKARKIRQGDVARWTGINQAHLSKFENGKVDIRLSTLKKIIQAVGLEIMLIDQVDAPLVKEFLAGQAVTSDEYDPPSILLQRYGVSDDEE